MTTVKVLVGKEYVPNTATAMYTVPDQTRTIITKATVTAFATTTLSVWLVARQGSNANSNVIINAFTVPSAGGRAVELDELEGQPLQTGEVLYMAAGAASSLIVNVGGIEISN